MRVLQIAARMASLTSFALPLMERLRNEGLEVETLGRFDGFEQRLTEAGLRVHPWCAGHTFNPFTIQHARRELAGFLDRGHWDIVHTHGSFAGTIGNPVAYHRARHLLYTQHGFYVHDGLNPVLRRAWLSIEKIGLRWAHRVICISEAEHALALSLGVGPPEKFVVIPGAGVDVGAFNLLPADRQLRRSALRAALGIGEDECVLLTVSRLTWDKGYREMIDAAQLLKSQGLAFRVLAAGDGKDAGAIRRAVDRAEVGDCFILLGWRNDTVDLYCAADVFVFASHREGLPIAPIEAMASGLPVILSDLPGCREEVEHETHGLVYAVGDATALAACIQRLLADPDLAQGLAAAAAERARDFDLRVALDRQADLYKQIAEQP